MHECIFENEECSHQRFVTNANIHCNPMQAQQMLVLK